MTDPVVIVGSGLAGYTVAKELRKLDPAARIVLLTRDDGAWYSKPMLSNALSARKSAAELAASAAAQMAAQLAIEVRTHTEITAIDPELHELRTNAGTLRYASLVLALGADPVPLQIEGAAENTYTVNASAITRVSVARSTARVAWQYSARASSAANSRTISRRTATKSVWSSPASSRSAGWRRKRSDVRCRRLSQSRVSNGASARSPNASRASPTRGCHRIRADRRCDGTQSGADRRGQQERRARERSVTRRPRVVAL